MIGDVLLTTPVLTALKRRYPGCHLALLTDGLAAELVKGHPAIDDLIVYNTNTGKQKFTFSDLTRHFKVLNYIRRQKFDLAINLHPSARGGRAVKWSGAECRVGYDARGKNNKYYNVLVPDDGGVDRYRVDYLLDPLRALGIDVEVELPTLGISEEDRQAVRQYLEAGQGPLIVLHPGRTDTPKSWKDDRFASLADALVVQYGVRLIFIGAPSEADRVDSIMSMMRQPSMSLAGKLGLRHVGALLEGADLFIGIDSSPLHIASAVGTPTIALFGPSDTTKWNPPGPNHICIQKRFDKHPNCLPHNCWKTNCSPCMSNIQVGDVLAEVEKVIPLSVENKQGIGL